MKYKRIVLFAFLITPLFAVLGFTYFDGDDIIIKVAAQLEKWAESNPQEKVYLHLDKPYYAIGDDIWFKAYITAGNKHQLSAISKIVTVELIDDRDSVQKAIRLPVNSGVAWGDFKLADSLKEGNYRLRAYTNWMRNAGPEYFYDKTIPIGNSINNKVFTSVIYNYITLNNQQKVNAVITYTDIDGKPYTSKEVFYEVTLDTKRVERGKGITDAKGSLNVSFVNNAPALRKSGHISTQIKLDDKQLITKNLPVKATGNTVDVQFFPESGSLVNGIRSKVAFKATAAGGLGVDVKGTILDNQNNEIVKIESQHLGMGAFVLLPESGISYKAKLSYPDGSEAIINLPVASDKGFVLNVYNNSNTDDILVKIALNQNTLQEYQNTDINLVAQCSGVVVYAAKSKLESLSFSTRIPKNRFPSGIVQFTLFSAKGDPLNERIAFIQNPDMMNISLNTAKATYVPREKAKLTVDAKTLDGKPVTGTFSIAVIDETKVKVDENTEGNILANVLLTSDIKGYIEKPGYYFNNVNDKTRADLDLLMLTQGYRRFDWKQLMANVFPPAIFPAEKSIDISGSLKTPGGKVVPHGKVTLFSTTGGIFLLDTVTDDQGKFAFKNLVFTDSVKFVIQARTQKDRKNVEIELDNILPQLVTKNKNSGDVEVNISSVMAPYLQNSKTQYDDFLRYGLVTRSNLLKEVAISDKKKSTLPNSQNLNGPGNADQVIRADQLSTCVTLSQCLLGRINFVQFRNGMAYSTRSPNTPMLINVDGMNMEPDFLDQINSSDVESVEVLRSGGNTSIYGGQGSGGVLVITTKRGGGGNYQRYAPGVITYSPRGYYRARTFYSPQYDDPKTNSKVADLRTTIYWNPNIITDKNGNASVEFFNADTKGTYRTVIEGIDADGNLGRTVYRYKVE